MAGRQITMDKFFTSAGTGPQAAMAKRKPEEDAAGEQKAKRQRETMIENGEETPLRVAPGQDSDRAIASSRSENVEPPPEITFTELNRMVALARARNRQARERVSKASAKGVHPALRDLLVCEKWGSALEAQFGQKYFGNLESFIRREWDAKISVFPAKENIFRALNACPLDQVKVVILGQDPYHNVGQAMGLSFSVPEGVALPSSLRNVFKEIRSDLSTETQAHGNLERWAAQGVLLLNSVLTVRAHQAGSHQKKGWEAFTEQIIKAVSVRQENVVFLLWGRWAQERGRIIRKRENHCILSCAHPSGLSANRGFFGCRHFSKANAYLQGQHKQPIKW